MGTGQKAFKNLLGFSIFQHLVPLKIWLQALSGLSTKHWQTILSQEGKTDQFNSFTQSEGAKVQKSR